jgi:hypothetical protein
MNRDKTLDALIDATIRELRDRGHAILPTDAQIADAMYTAAAMNLTLVAKAAAVGASKTDTFAKFVRGLLAKAN